MSGYIRTKCQLPYPTINRKSMTKIVKILKFILRLLKKIYGLRKYINFGNVWTEIVEETEINPFTDEKLQKNTMEDRKRNSRRGNRRVNK